MLLSRSQQQLKNDRTAVFVLRISTANEVPGRVPRRLLRFLPLLPILVGRQFRCYSCVMGRGVRFEVKLSAWDRRRLDQLLSGGLQSVRTVFRALALRQMNRGQSTPVVGGSLGLSAKAVWQICKRYKQEGLERALFDAARPGIAPALGQRQTHRSTMTPHSDRSNPFFERQFRSMTRSMMATGLVRWKRLTAHWFRFPRRSSCRSMSQALPVPFGSSAFRSSS